MAAERDATRGPFDPAAFSSSASANRDRNGGKRSSVRFARLDGHAATSFLSARASTLGGISARHQNSAGSARREMRKGDTKGSVDAPLDPELPFSRERLLEPERSMSDEPGQE